MYVLWCLFLSRERFFVFVFFFAAHRGDERQLVSWSFAHAPNNQEKKSFLFCTHKKSGDDVGAVEWKREPPALSEIRRATHFFFGAIFFPASRGQVRSFSQDLRDKEVVESAFALGARLSGLLQKFSRHTHTCPFRFFLLLLLISHTRYTPCQIFALLIISPCCLPP